MLFKAVAIVVVGCGGVDFVVVVVDIPIVKPKYDRLNGLNLLKLEDYKIGKLMEKFGFLENYFLCFDKI
jgi:hypothetical protein